MFTYRRPNEISSTAGESFLAEGPTNEVLDVYVSNRSARDCECGDSLILFTNLAWENESLQSTYQILKEQIVGVEEYYFCILVWVSSTFPQMIFQQPNPGVHYEYILPSEKPVGPQQPGHRPEGYYSNFVWLFNHFKHKIINSKHLID